MKKRSLHSVNEHFEPDFNAAMRPSALCDTVRLRIAGIETVNLYTAFVALTVLLMEKGGEIVAIIPRSFCNGSYYRPFRNLILRTCSIRQLHLFESRNQAFHDDGVLQENIIIHLVKGEPQGAVIVSTSHDAKFSDYQQTAFDAAVIVKPNDAEQFIHIPTAIGQTSIPKFCTHTLLDIGLEVCTGPVVDFRLREYWRDEPAKDTCPLLYPHHFNDGALCWPKPHKKTQRFAAFFRNQQMADAAWPLCAC
ncbi:MAG: hypothetical protein HY936_10690 [Nitrosomonadales bacterium]|nr:hypothetical protein [Nitrosomonadales bacterium]